MGWAGVGAQVVSRSPPELAGHGNPGSLTGRPVATLIPNIPSAEEPEEWVASPHLVAQGRGDLLGLEVAENYLLPQLPLQTHHPANDPKLTSLQTTCSPEHPQKSPQRDVGWFIWRSDLEEACTASGWPTPSPDAGGGLGCAECGLCCEAPLSLEWGCLPSLFLLLSGVFAPARQQQLPLHRPQSTQLPHPFIPEGKHTVVFAFKPKNHLPSEWALLFLLFPPPPTPFPTALPSAVQLSPRGRSQPAPLPSSSLLRVLPQGFPPKVRTGSKLVPILLRRKLL